MKKRVSVMCLLLFLWAMLVPVYAEESAVKELCDPKKLEQCKYKIDELLKSVEALRAKLLAAQADLQKGTKLTEQEANLLLQRAEAIKKSIPEIKDRLWDN